MGAGYAVLTIEQGSLFSTTLELKDGNDNAIDLTGYTGQSYFRKSYYSDNNVYQLTVGVNSPETDGKITLSATSEYTETVKPGRYVYDVEIISGGTRTRVLEGIVDVKPNATKIGATGPL